jgi:hypothetical protein
MPRLLHERLGSRRVSNRGLWNYSVVKEQVAVSLQRSAFSQILPQIAEVGVRQMASHYLLRLRPPFSSPSRTMRSIEFASAISNIVTNGILGLSGIYRDYAGFEWEITGNSSAIPRDSGRFWAFRGGAPAR